MFDLQTVGGLFYWFLNWGLLPAFGLYILIRLTVFIYKWATISGRSYLYLPLASSIFIFLFFNFITFVGYFSMEPLVGEACTGECTLIIVAYGIIFLGVFLLNLLTQFVVAVIGDRKRTKNKIINN